MSIAAISSSFVSAVRASATTAPADPVQPQQEAPRSHREGGRRHELVDAMNQVLGTGGEQGKDQAQAVFRFAHALMHDLRTIDTGGAAGHGHGHAWGRRDWSDLPQRVDALATAVGASANAPGVAPPATAPSDAPLASVVEAVEAAPAPEVPLPTNPVTTTSAAVHLMQVPSSHLIEAYEALRQAMGQQSDAPLADGLRSDLAAFLDRLAGQLAPDAASAVPAGSVMHVTA